MEKLLLERQKGGRDRLIEVVAQQRFNFPFFSTTISSLFTDPPFSLQSPSSARNKNIACAQTSLPPPSVKTR